MAGCHVPVPWQGGLTPTFGSLAQFRSGVWRNVIRNFVPPKFRNLKPPEIGKVK